ncbi:MAG: transcriptional repressor [Candidatus Woesearchaeota archaeon]
MHKSRQRDVVLQFVENSHEHPSAEEVFLGVKRKMPEIARGTIYRNLNQLQKVGKVQALRVANTTRFDNASKHAHLVCINCHKIMDVQMPEIKVPRHADFTIQNVKLDFNGLCKECYEVNKNGML